MCLYLLSFISLFLAVAQASFINPTNVTGNCTTTSANLVIDKDLYTFCVVPLEGTTYKVDLISKEPKIFVVIALLVDDMEADSAAVTVSNRLASATAASPCSVVNSQFSNKFQAVNTLYFLCSTDSEVLEINFASTTTTTFFAEIILSLFESIPGKMDSGSDCVNQDSDTSLINKDLYCSCAPSKSVLDMTLDSTVNVQSAMLIAQASRPTKATVKVAAKTLCTININSLDSLKIFTCEGLSIINGNKISLDISDKDALLVSEFLPFFDPSTKSTATSDITSCLSSKQTLVRLSNNKYVCKGNCAAACPTSSVCVEKIDEDPICFACRINSPINWLFAAILTLWLTRKN